jgi:hypothetical protein
MSQMRNLGRSAMAVIQAQAKARKQPPTEEKLAFIWPPWNALPGRLHPQERYHILTNDPGLGDAKLLARLARKFPFLPLDPHDYHSSFQAAELWHKLTLFVQTTFKLHKSVIESQWAFNESDSQAAGRIAIFRAAQELEITTPGMLTKTAPTLSEINLLQIRFNAYKAARETAFTALSAILYKIPGIRRGRVSLKRQARGIPRPPEDVPHHLYIARLDALNICSQAGFEEFRRDDFPKLTRKQRQDFYRVSLSPKYGKESHAALKVWLLDNVPVFEQFDWRWADIHTAALERGLLDPKKHTSHESLEKWASRNKVTWSMKTGVGRQQKEQMAVVARSSPLLSPAPKFGDRLKSA